MLLCTVHPFSFEEAVVCKWLISPGRFYPHDPPINGKWSMLYEYPCCCFLQAFLLAAMPFVEWCCRHLSSLSFWFVLHWFRFAMRSNLRFIPTLDKRVHKMEFHPKGCPYFIVKFKIVKHFFLHCCELGRTG